ncbi:hypothetical protein L1F30_11585 [Simiduia sp. 21SJ11W-1]|uniref:hypothetical protein n=1 Tax=Simiduia sp. 21SJ11W-1 TaxID=2909669 RepID=UPI00209E83B2|nr:hypothetical protein [Simiduia sp. 21SJ11W-1]UTA46801.1 hypothetical protein L1F30_11585 [Simiduia sp. 21SJ11W-1]
MGYHKLASNPATSQITANYTLRELLKENPVSSTYLVNDPNKSACCSLKNNPPTNKIAARSAAKLTQIKHPHSKPGG